MVESHRAFARARRTRSSFDCDNTDALAQLLLGRGFQPLATNPHERYRLVNATRTMIAVIYETGAVLAQGRDSERLAAYIARAGGAR